MRFKQWLIAQMIGLALMVVALIVFVSGDADAGPVALGIFLLGGLLYGASNFGATFFERY